MLSGIGYRRINNAFYKSLLVQVMLQSESISESELVILSSMTNSSTKTAILDRVIFVVTESRILDLYKETNFGTRYCSEKHEKLCL